MEKLGQSWKSLSLSHGGRETLLKSVYQSIPTYIMSCFLLPKDITNKMDSRLNAFFWGGSMTKKSIHWTKASILTKPKSAGGMGFKNFRMFNLALMAKQGWRIISNPNQTWVRFLKGLYFPNNNFMEASKGKHASWIWTSLCDSREVLGKGMRLNCVSGKSIRVGVDPWIPTVMNFKLNTVIERETIASQWINRVTGNWNRDDIAQSCSWRETEEVLKIPIGPEDMDDKWVWHFDTQGTFSVRSAYQVARSLMPSIDEDRLNHLDQGIWKWIWKISIPPKFIIFLWRIARNALGTKRNLWRRNCSPSPACPVCENDNEDIKHCLFLCPRARDVWSKMEMSSIIPNNSEDIIQKVYTRCTTNNGPCVKRCIATMWSIWKARNEKVFRDANLNADAIVIMTSKTLNEWSLMTSNQMHMSLARSSITRSIPSPPPLASTHQEIFCDGSFDQNSSTAGYGVIVRNPHGQVIDGKAGKLLCSSALVAEAKAVLEALRLAERSNIQSYVRSDSLVIVNALRGEKERWPWQCYAWLLIMKNILLAHDRISLSFAPRSLNQTADWVAKSARSDNLPYDWISYINVSM
ncbi:Putative ribonuclease H protein At1g65750 [Linum perenne]